MKSKLIIALFISYIFTCVPAWAQVLNVSGPLGGMSNASLLINTGMQADNLNLPHQLMVAVNPTNPSLTWARSLRFIAEFKNGCSYVFTGGATTNQIDWNKLMSIAYLPFPDFTSIKLGWRWNPTKGMVELGLYGHIQHVDGLPESAFFSNHEGREFLHVRDVPQNTGIECELILGAEGIGVIAGNVGSFIKRRSMLPPADPLTGAPIAQLAMFKSAFFGGQENAPNHVVIDVININSDHHTNWHFSSCEKTFSRSKFFSGETLTIEASTSIKMSEQVFRGQFDVGTNQPFNTLPAQPSIPPVQNRDEVPWFESDGERFVIVEPGANITTMAGSEIALLPGFEAQHGSNYGAFIANWVTCATWAGRATGTSDAMIDAYGETNKETEGFEPGITTNDKAGEINSIFNSTSGFFGVFPNPTTGIFTVKLEKESSNASIEICSTLGVRLMIEPVKGTDSKVDISSLPNGIYTVYLLENGSRINYGKLVKN